LVETLGTYGKLERYGYPTVKKLKIHFLVSTEYTNVTDRRTDGQTLHDGINRAYTQHREAKSSNARVIYRPIDFYVVYTLF